MVCFDSGNAYADPLREVTPLYRHAQPAPVVTEVINKLLAIIDRHTVKLGWGEKPITLAELVIARDGSDELEYCRVAMLQAGISAVIPDGYVMVPREPTEEMNKAGWAAMNEHDAINPTYRAMLAAAPHDTPDLNSVQSVATVPGKWIQVSERMPEVGVKVLCFPVKDEPIHATFNGQLWLQDISWSGSDEPIDNVIPTSVTHWMPLPTAPQEEKP